MSLKLQVENQIESSSVSEKMIFWVRISLFLSNICLPLKLSKLKKSHIVDSWQMNAKRLLSIYRLS